jgi:hypothetical protein
MRLRSLLVLFLWCAAFASSTASADDSEKPKNGKPADVSQCVAVRTEALYIVYGYDHHVHLTNGCDKAVRCEVTTSSNPDPTTVALAKGEHQDIVMFRSSPASAVNAKVKCKAADS